MPIQHPQVRHLYWSICSDDLAQVTGIPSLTSIDAHSVYRWCLSLEQNPTPLEDYIASREHRLLGSYFEVLWQFFLSHYPGWQLLGSGIQIPPKGPTLGELDILCTSPNGDPLHIELAVKFYLRHPDTDGGKTSHWLGPKTVDRLDLKLSKLANKQFAMLTHPLTQQTLTDLDLPSQAAPTSVIKGYLFTPYQCEHSQIPEECGQINVQGQWLHAHQVDTLLAKHAHWQYIPKWQWLGEYRQTEAPMSAQTLSEYCHAHFSQPNYALMLIALNNTSSDWVESKRYMVVHNGWPNDE